MLDALGEIQLELRRLRLDGWLVYDRARINPVACQLLGLDVARSTRPLAFLLHAEELPHLVVHASDAPRFADLPGDRSVYVTRASFVDALSRLLKPGTRLAVEHTPMAALPDACWIDGGSLELLRSFGAELVSSSTLVARFVAAWSERDVATHCEAAARGERAFGAAWQRLATSLEGADEQRLSSLLREELGRVDLLVDDGPVVAAGVHSADAEHRPDEPRSIGLAPGTPLVVGLRVRCRSPIHAAWSVRYWTAFVGREAPERLRTLFLGASAACDHAVQVLRERFEREEAVLGCEVDAAVRRDLAGRRLDGLLVHRTGHSLGTRSCEGLGAHLDDLETHDTRPVLAGSGLAITPGLYDRDLGVRVAANVVLDEQGVLRVTAARQPEIVVLP